MASVALTDVLAEADSSTEVLSEAEGENDTVPEMVDVRGFVELCVIDPSDSDDDGVAEPSPLAVEVRVIWESEADGSSVSVLDELCESVCVKLLLALLGSDNDGD